MQIRVRALGAGDRAAWEELFHGYLVFYRAELSDAQVELTWQRLLSDEEELLVGLVAVDENDVPFGLAHLLFHRSTWAPTYYCYLEDLFVDPAKRVRGAGRALIDATYAEADRRGCTRTYWMTEEGNARARALYDRVATKSPFVQYRR